jgi:hypothetical protein
MPIGFSDLLKTTAQLDNNLTKGIVNTDETYGGIRSKIDDWTDLHLSTFNSGAGYTYQDDGTAAAPGHFKAYSTMFYVADGRSLVEDSTATADFIRLDASGNYVGSGGTKYVVDSGAASPGYYVLKDAAQVGGTGTGTNKLPKFSITGAQGSDTSTALPAGYESFTAANNSSPAITVTDTNADTTFNLLFSTAGADQSLFVDATTGTLQYNPNSGTLTLGTSVQSVSLSTGTFGATGDIVSDLIPGNAAGEYTERDLGSSTLPWHELYVKDAIYFEGTADAYETQIVATDPTADNVITLPNATGTLAFENADTSGNAATATALAAAVEIGGVSFDGSQDIDLPGVNTAGDQNTSGTAAKATAIAGGALGSVPYQSGADTTAFLTGNTAATNLFMRSVGTGAAAQAPTFAAVTAADVGLGNVTNASQATIVAAAATAGDLAYVKLDGSSTIGGAAPLTFEGASADGFETTLAVTDPTQDNTITLPDATGTVALSSNHLGFFASTTSAQLANVLSDETGTGNVVFSAGPTLTGTITAAAANFSGAVSITGNLTVAGDFISQEATIVTFRDKFLDLNVSGDLNDDYTSDSGFHFGRSTSGVADQLDEKAAFTYDATNDLFKFTRHTDSATGDVGSADNVKALKFGVTTSSLGAEANATNDVADLYATANTARSNNTNVRSVGAVSKCSIDITTDSSDDGSNFAPVAAAANGYPIQHDLSSSSVFVFALKTHQAGADGAGGAATLIAEPQPIFCKFKVISADIVEVSVGITLENEKYDIIVIG